MTVHVRAGARPLPAARTGRRVGGAGPGAADDPNLRAPEPYHSHRCERVRVRFQQRNVGGEWEALGPGAAADFAWEEPLAARRLRVRLDGCGGAWRDCIVHEYSLDVLRARLKRLFHHLEQAHIIGLGCRSHATMRALSAGRALAAAAPSATAPFTRRAWPCCRHAVGQDWATHGTIRH